MWAGVVRGTHFWGLTESDTLESFKKSYSRGVVVRLVAAFQQHRHKSKPRFEEAARL